MPKETNHPIPDEALIDHLAVLAKTGAGKTYLAKGIVERLLAQKKRVCIVDPKNAWWGLKSSADGKKDGFSVVIFGGPNADVPLLANHGKVLGEAVATTDMSCIICTKGMTEKDRIRFLTDFFQTLDQKNSEPLHLVLDEAHMMAPQKPLGEMQRLTHYTSELVSGGRGMGFRIILLSQRPARLNKDVLTQCESLVAMRMTGPQDRNAVKAWILDQADIERGKEIIASLPTLKNGEGWVWMPAADVLKRVTFPLINTYDNSKTKRDSGADAKARLAPVDLTKLQSKLEKVKGEIEANDPAALKKKVADLTKQLAARVPATAPKVGVSVEDQDRLRQEGFAAGVKERDKSYAVRLKQVEKALKQGKLHLQKTADAYSDLERALADGYADVAVAASYEKLQKYKAQYPHKEVKVEVAVDPSLPTNAAFMGAAALKHNITRSQQKVLNALAWWAAADHDNPTKEMVAVVAGYKPTSGGFNNLLSELNKAGLIDRVSPGVLALTGAGLGIVDRGFAREPLMDRVASLLTSPQLKVLQAVMREYPDEVDRAKVAEMSGYSETSGGFNNLLSELSTLKMIERTRPKFVRCAGWLTA